ncbi:MAG: hypothetical protein AB8H12_00805 [Lewinella sp.]
MNTGHEQAPWQLGKNVLLAYLWLSAIEQRKILSWGDLVVSGGPVGVAALAGFFS